MKLSKRHTIGRKKVAILIACAAVLVLMAAYVMASFVVWSNYKDAYTNWQSDVKSKLDMTMNMPTESSDQRMKWLTALDLVMKLTALPNKCTVNGVYGWQQLVVPAIKQDVTNCGDIQKKMDALHASLFVVAGGVRAGEAIAGILAEPLKGTSVSDTAYQAEVDAWTEAGVSLSKVETPNEVMGVKSAAILAVGAIKTAWDVLKAANVAQNASQYQAALNGLSQAYSGLNNVSNESKKALLVVGNAMQESYNKAF